MALLRENVFFKQLPLPGSENSHGFAADLAERGVDPATVAGSHFRKHPRLDNDALSTAIRGSACRLGTAAQDSARRR